MGTFGVKRASDEYFCPSTVLVISSCIRNQVSPKTYACGTFIGTAFRIHDENTSTVCKYRYGTRVFVQELTPPLAYPGSR